MLNFKRKKILVTGASSGIGRATAILLSQYNSDIILVGRNEAELLQTGKKLNEGNHKVLVCDLSNIDQIADLITQAVEYDNRKLYGIVHSAGQSAIVPLKAITYQKLDYLMRINYYAFIELVKQFSLKKNSDGGAVVGVSSIASTNGESCQTIYAATKAAMDASVRTLAYELVKRKIRINSVMPGAIDTGIKIQNVDYEMHMKAQAEKQLLGLGKPIDVANMITFLLSEASSFITGRSFYVDGGRN